MTVTRTPSCWFGYSDHPITLDDPMTDSGFKAIRLSGPAIKSFVIEPWT